MEAVILAGGFATRLYPLTLTIAKPLIPIAGVPGIFRIMERLAPLVVHGLERVVVVSNEKFADDFRAALASWPVPPGVSVEAVSNGAMTVEQKLGAIGDMALGAREVGGGRPFLVLAGDNLFDFDLGAAWQEFERLAGRPLVLTHRVPTPEETRPYNNLELAPDGRITRFIEKPADPQSTLFATCMYFFPGHVAGRLKEYLAEGNDPDKAGNFIAWLATCEPVHTFEPGGWWYDVGSVEGVEIASRHYGNR
jgi:glucose-1-phosphate thymidylyltransferase